jgi:hypothetical protein
VKVVSFSSMWNGSGSPSLNVANFVSEAEVLAVHYALAGSALNWFLTPVGVLSDADLGRRQLLPQRSNLGYRVGGACHGRSAVNVNNVHEA